MIATNDSAGSVLTPEALSDRLIEDIKRSLGELPEEGALQRIAEGVVRELWSDDVKVTSFIPVLAMRRVRDMIEAEALLHSGGETAVS